MADNRHGYCDAGNNRQIFSSTRRCQSGLVVCCHSYMGYMFSRNAFDAWVGEGRSQPDGTNSRLLINTTQLEE